MDICTILVAALAFIVVTDFVMLLNASRIVKRRIQLSAAREGDTALFDKQAMVLRMALGLAIAVTIGIFLFLLSKNGCLA